MGKPREFWICEAEDEDHNTGVFVMHRPPSDSDEYIFSIYHVRHIDSQIDDAIQGMVEALESCARGLTIHEYKDREPYEIETKILMTAECRSAESALAAYRKATK